MRGGVRFVRRLIMTSLSYDTSTPTLALGRMQVTSLFDGWLSLDGGAMFGVVPKTLWEKKLPADELNRVKMPMRPLLVRTPGGPLVVEAGIGQAITGKLTSIYGIDRPGLSLDEQVRRQGVDPAQVRHVVLTHLHFDHAGGCCKLLDGKYVPCFPDAEHHVQEVEWDTAIAHRNVHKASYVPPSLLPLKERGLLHLHQGSGAIVPGIRYELTRGHTQNHSVVWIEDGEHNGCFMGDLIETSAHVPMPWISAYDYSTGESFKARQRLYPEFARRKTVLFIYHDPSLAALRLLRDGEKWDFEKVS
jgi:glyoxylase-like metal-dependent hydrolase (beta-lactamase superfamily II)